MFAEIDYGAGNLQSVVKALTHIGCESVITRDKETLLRCDGAILPGVGSFGDAMHCMEQRHMRSAVLAFKDTGKPFLGICLGLQLLFPGSEESPGVDGLSFFQGSIRKIPNTTGKLKIPHMGWNSLSIRDHSGIYAGIEENPYVYFVHSYYLKAAQPSIVTAQTEYGGTVIDASVQYNNVIATQFHPEKSGETGLKMLKNFAGMAGQPI